MKTVFKFAFFVLLSISALGFLITAFLYIFAPDETGLAEDSQQVVSVSDSADDEVSAPTAVSVQETAPTDEIIEAEVPPDQESVAAGEKEKTAPPPAVKQVDWDLTPTEQELEVGDWISIDGYQDDLIGATIEKHAATRVLKWNDPSALYGTNGMVAITSQSTGLSAPSDRIVSVVGLVENPRENETVVEINKALLEEQTVLIRAIGQIDRIAGAKTPKRWTVFLKKGVHVDFARQQKEENDSP
ncbi:hypothetical protein F4Z99_09450 [Candidatus Poribacteria bacterium]|nr:hypothetical protein [Candidatus Poribacteria bacterium]MYA98813.1 hypothetical protein [Candidatus Poribacteria bacterium]